MSVAKILAIIVMAALIILSGCSYSDPALPGAYGDANPVSGYTVGSPGGALGSVTDQAIKFTGRPPSEYAPDQVLVYLGDNPAPLSQVIAVASGHGLELIKEHAHSWGTYYQFRITDGSAVLDKCVALKAMPQVEIAEPNYLARPLAAPKTQVWPDDPLWESMWDADTDPASTTRDQWGPHLYGADIAWNDYTGDGVVIAIIDTGVNSHEDLNPNLWTNPGEIPNNGIDDDDNGYIDDIHGWDFEGHDKNYSDPGYPGWDKMIYHGSACSGVAAGRGGNGKGITGIAPDAKIMCVRVDLMGGQGYYATIIDGITYAHENGADIASMSFGGYDDSELVEMACEAAYEDGNGTLLVAAAGNEDTYWAIYPASYTSVMCIGACTSFGPEMEPWNCRRISYDYFGWGSNYGGQLEVVAPGIWYIGVYGGGFNEYETGVNEYDYFGGTSCATPFTSGSLALLKEAFPGMSAAELRTRLKDMADDMGTEGQDQYYGRGRVNILRAIYGTDPNADLADADGFIPVEASDMFFDNINPNPAYGYKDAADYYKFTAPQDVSLPVILEIYTWGKDLKLEVYDNPYLDGDPIKVSDIVNGPPPTNREMLTVEAVDGNTYYFAISGQENLDCTSYKLITDGDYVSDEVKLSITSSPLTEVTAGSSGDWIGNVKFEVASGEAYIDKLTLSVHGNLSPQYIGNFKLASDADHSGSYEQGVDPTVYTSGSFSPVNRADVDLTGLKVTEDNPVEFFILIPLDLDTPIGNYVGIAAVTYKDLLVSTPNYVHHGNLPQMTDLKITTKAGVLFVDDDEGTDCEDWYLPHLNEMGVKYNIVQVPMDGNGPNANTMKAYEIVMWVTGPSIFPLTSTDRSAIYSYISAGGHFFMSSRDLGFQAYYDYFTGWLGTVLHADYLSNDAGADSVDGVSGDPITDGLDNLSIVGGNPYTDGWYDLQNPIGGATAILKYYGISTYNAGLRYQNGDSRLVYLFFPVESMGDYDERQELLERCIDWLAED